MTEKTKLRLKYGIISGLLFALMMTGFDFIIGEEFNFWKILIYFLSFGVIMGFIVKIKT